MAKVVGPSAFLNEFGVKNERVKILHLLDRHGGTMTLSDVIDASAEPALLAMHKVCRFRERRSYPVRRRLGDRRTSRSLAGCDGAAVPSRVDGAWACSAEIRVITL